MYSCVSMCEYVPQGVVQQQGATVGPTALEKAYGGVLMGNFYCLVKPLWKKKTVTAVTPITVPNGSGKLQQRSSASSLGGLSLKLQYDQLLNWLFQKYLSRLDVVLMVLKPWGYEEIWHVPGTQLNMVVCSSSTSGKLFFGLFLPFLTNLCLHSSSPLTGSQYP